jgi:3D (Asp-Asp-Asp) domain-containing protein
VLQQVRSATSHLLRLSHRLTSRERTLGVATREAAATAAELTQTRSARSAYIADLTRRRALDSAQIARLDAEAQAAERQAQRLTLSTTVAPSATYAPQKLVARVAGRRTVNVIATGYDLSGTTSTGLPVGWGVAAVDPTVIPLGTHLTIPGYGEAVAADTGPSVVGATIDLWFPTAAQANAWGRRSVAVGVH